MATWGGIQRAIEEGLLDAGDYDSGGGSQNIAEALTGQDFTGFRMRDLFDKDRWSRREREEYRQGRRLEETGIPDYTYDYNPRNQGGSVQVDISPITGRPSDRPGHPAYINPTPLGNIRQWGTQNPNVPGSMALDPTWAGGLRGAGLGAEMTQGEDRSIDPAILSKLRREPAWIDKPAGGIQRRFGDREFSPRSRTGRGIAGGRKFGGMTLAEARRARELRNETRRPGMGGGPAYQGHGLGHPDWSQIEAMIQREAILDEIEGGRE